MESTATRLVSEIVWRNDLYPRIETSAATVQRYAENLDVLPPIEINQHNELIDGWHRWTAHRKQEAETIPVTVTQTASDMEFLKLAIVRNASHGLQLDDKSKKDMAIRLYAGGSGLSKEDIKNTLSVSIQMVRSYLSDIDKQLRERQREQIVAMWMACYTEDEIAESVGMSQRSVGNDIESFSKNESTFVFAKTLDGKEDFTPPIYNIWSFAAKTNGVSHFGNSEQRIVDNLLYLYTEPFDIVLDPFAGGGSTIDVCLKRNRRHWCSDRKPIPEREREIRKLDIVSELPPLNKRWSEVTLTYLDPPYWRQAAGQYSKDAEDLANMPLDEFTDKLAGVVRRIAEKQSRGVIALLIQPTQWLADDRQFTDHVLDLIRLVGNKRLAVDFRVSCPYSTQQMTPQMVDWAKENKRLLVLTRELIIWRVVS